MTPGFEPSAYLRALFQAAVDAADPRLLLPRHLPPTPRGRTIVVGAGKAGAAMAASLDTHWQAPLTGLVVTRHGHGMPSPRIEIVEAGHPVPDQAGADAARRMLAMVGGLSADDLVICLLSGGGSALLSLPAPGLTLQDLQAVTGQLLRCGAPIDAMNVLRKHLSAIAGGRLAAAAYPARVITLAISDVPGDAPESIASGPTVADPSSFGDANEIVRRYDLDLPDAVVRHLAEAADETPKPGDPRLAGAEFRLIASPHEAIETAAARARREGGNVFVLGDAIEGEARDIGRAHADIVRGVLHDGVPLAPPTTLLSGGETTVTIRGHGRGGPNSEYLLSLAIALDGAAGVYAIACDTDGIDGSADNAGAVIGPQTLSRAVTLGLDAGAMLAENDAYGFFAGIGDLVVTGPTYTNVNDFRAILIDPALGTHP